MASSTYANKIGLTSFPRGRAGAYATTWPIAEADDALKERFAAWSGRPDPESSYVHVCWSSPRLPVVAIAVELGADGDVRFAEATLPYDGAPLRTGSLGQKRTRVPLSASGGKRLNVAMPMAFHAYNGGLKTALMSCHDLYGLAGALIAEIDLGNAMPAEDPILAFCVADHTRHFSVEQDRYSLPAAAATAATNGQVQYEQYEQEAYVPRMLDDRIARRPRPAVYRAPWAIKAVHRDPAVARRHRNISMLPSMKGKR